MIRIITYSVFIVLVMITPFIYSGDLFNGIITARQIWFYGSMALLITGFATDILITKRKTLSGLNIIDISLLTFYLYFLVRAVYTPYTPVLYNQKFLNYSLLILFYFIVKHICAGSFYKVIEYGNKEWYKNLTINIIVHVLILTGLIQATWGLLQWGGFIRSFHPGFRVTGTFFNPAPYALYLAAIFPIALGFGIRKLKNKENPSIKELKNEKIKEYKWSKPVSLFALFFNNLKQSSVYFMNRRFRQYIAIATVVLILLVLPATMNRASWVGIAAGSILVFDQKYNLHRKVKSFIQTGIRKLVVIAGLLLAAAVISIVLYQLKPASSFGRLFIWEVTMSKISEKPLFGYGIGRFEAEYNNWQAGYFQNNPKQMDEIQGVVAGNTKYCFNEYIEMAAEIGFTGLFLFCIVTGSVFYSIKRNMVIGTNDNSDSSFVSFLLSSFVSLLVCAFISFPFYSLPTLIVFLLLLAMISSQIREIGISKKFMGFSLIQRIPRQIVFFIFLPVSVFLFGLAIRQFKGYHNWERAAVNYRIGNYKEALTLFSENISPFQYNGTYLQYYGKTLNLNKKYLQSIEMLERASLFTSDEFLYLTLGDSFQSLKRYSEAEKAYQYASCMAPHELYPNYLLANMYADTGQKEKALYTAGMILNKRIKVESSATDEIRFQMKEMISKLNK